MNRIIQAVSKNNTREWTKEELIQYIKDNSLDCPYISYYRNRFILDGEFTVEELEALLIAWETGR